MPLLKNFFSVLAVAVWHVHKQMLNKK